MPRRFFRFAVVTGRIFTFSAILYYSYPFKRTEYFCFFFPPREFRAAPVAFRHAHFVDDKIFTAYDIRTFREIITIPSAVNVAPGANAFPSLLPPPPKTSPRVFRDKNNSPLSFVFNRRIPCRILAGSGIEIRTIIIILLRGVHSAPRRKFDRDPRRALKPSRENARGIHKTRRRR